MKAVLCLWAREHLKGRPGPGSGFALLERRRRRRRKRERESKKKKKPTTLSSVYALACVFGKERLKKKKKKGRNRTVIPGSSWQRTDRLVGGDERRGMKELVLTSPPLRVSSPVWLCCRWGAWPTRSTLSDGECERCERGEEDGGLRGAGRGFLLHLSCRRDTHLDLLD